MMSEAKAGVMETLQKWLLPFVLVGLGWSYQYMNKLEDRLYTLQGQAVTEQKLQQTETRLMSYIDIRLNDLDGKLQVIIRQLDKQHSQ